MTAATTKPRTRRKATAAQTDAPTSAWPGRTVVILRGPGILDGACYFLDDVEITRTADEHMGRVYPWAPARDSAGHQIMEPHPFDSGTVCHVWSWQPEAGPVRA